MCWHEATTGTGSVVVVKKFNADLVAPQWTRLDNGKELNTPGSLDFSHSIRVETSKPIVENVSLSGDVYSSITSVNTVQTIDVFNVASILLGEYKLLYGDAMETTCIRWDAPATGTDSIKAALESIPGLALNVLVTQDTAAFHDGYRYTITFSFPSMGLQPLQVKSIPDTTCEQFTCSAPTRFPCDVGLVQPNQNSDIRTAAVVIQTGTPTLTIDTGAVTRDASYTTRSALQEFDVGVNMASPVLGGGFRLSYGDFSTGVGVGTTIDISANLKILTGEIKVQLGDVKSGCIAWNSSDDAKKPLLALQDAGCAAFTCDNGNGVSVACTGLSVKSNADFRASRAASEAISFRYLVQASDEATSLTYKISRVYSSTLGDTYTAGDAIIVLVEFSDTVIIQGKPILELNSKGEAFYVSGSVPISRIRCALCSGSGVDADITLPDPAVKVSSSRPDTVAGGVGYGAGDIVDIIVTYSADVSVIGSPSLTLNSGGTATFTYAGYRQLLDIGVNAVDPITSGQFTIVYDGKTSGCIDFNDAASTAATSLKSRLLEIEAIARMGIVSVTMTKEKNGNRFEVVFDSTGETAAVLNVVSANIALAGGAASIMRRSGSPTIVASQPQPTHVAFKYHIEAEDYSDNLAFASLTVLSEAKIYGVSSTMAARAATVLPRLTLVASAPMKSYLYLRVFSGSTLDVVTTASVSPINRVPNSLIEKVAVTVWQQKLYAAWDEGGLLFCALFEGLASINPWTLLPNMGINKNMAMKASDPALLVYNLELVVVWRENALPAGTTGLVGQIRVAILNYDTDAPLWIFHDGNQLNSGLNKNALMDADDPAAVVYRGRIPQFAVRRKGIEDMALVISWYRDTATSNVSEIITGQVLDLDWEASVTAGAPILMLSTQSNPLGFAACIDKSGLTTTVLSFTYIVQTGESSPKLEIFGTDAMKLNGAVIRDVFGQDPDFTLFPDASNLLSLSFNNKLAIDTTAPTVSSVTAKNPSGEYGVGELLQIQVIFTYPVAVVEGDASSPPTLALRSDELHLLTSSQGVATYVGGSGSDVLTFEYTAGQQDYCEKLDYMDAAALVLNGGGWAIKRNATRPTTDAILTLPPPKTSNSLSGARTIAIKPTQPSVVQVTSSTPDGTYYPGDSILLDYDVSIGDASADLDVVDDRVGDNQVYFVMSLLLAEHAEIKRASTQPYTTAVTALSAPGLKGSLSVSKNLVVNSIAPAVIDIRSTAVDGTYDVGEQIDVLLLFSRRVVVIGTPELILNVPSEYQRTAVYIDGSDTNTLRFSYFPKAGDNSGNEALDILDENSLILRPLLGGKELLQDQAQILGRSSNPMLGANIMLPVPGVAVRADAVLSLVGNNRKIFVRTDGFRVIELQADVPNGVYSPGQRIVLSVVFTGSTVVQGSPRLQLNANTAAYATYIGGTGTSRLQFEYIVATGDSCSVLEAASPSGLALNGGVISDSKGIYVPLRLAAATKPGSLSANYQIKITSTPPIVQRVYSKDTNDNYGVGDTLHLAVEFSRTVVLRDPPVVPAPSLLLQFDGRTRAAAYASGNKTTTFVFTIQIGNGDSTSQLEYASKTALTGSIFALSTTPTTAANLELPVPGKPGSLSDSSAIEFVYTVESGDHSARLDYAAADSLQCSILQSTAVPTLQATNTLPLPGALGSLSFASMLRIDALSPRVTSVSSGLANGVYSTGQSIDIAIAFSEPVLVPVGATPRLKLAIASNAAVDALLSSAAEPLATYTGGSGTNVLSFVYTVRVGDMALPLEYTGIDALSMSSQSAQLTAVGAEQKQFRFASLRLPVPGATGSLSNNRDIHLDTLEPPRVLGVGSPMADGIYTAGDTITLSVTFSAPVTVTGPNPTLRLETGNPDSPEAAKKAIYASGSGTSVLLFEYQVQLGDRVDRLEYTRCPLAERSTSTVRKWEKLVICSSTRNALQLGDIGSSIKRTATNPVTDAILHLPEVNEWAEVRFASSSAGVIYVAQVEPTTGIAKADLTLIAPLENEFSISHQRGSINLYSNGVPSHDTKLREKIVEQKYFIELQRFPTQQSRPLNLSREAADGFAGVFLNVVAYALDGYPVYGYYNEIGELPGDLDECHGRTRLNGQYGYHLVPPETSASKLAVFRYPADISAVEGLSLSELSRFESFVIDENPNTFHSAAWLNPDAVSVVYTSTTVIVRSTVHEQNYVFQFPRRPEISATRTSLPLDTAIGVMVNGVPFFAADSVVYSGNVLNSKNRAYVLLDKCNGLVDAGDCLLHKLGDRVGQPSPLIGFAFDGFPLYGPYAENGQMPTDLDACNGRVGDDGTYRYHVTLVAPYLLGCFRGAPATSQQSLDAADDLYRSLSYAHALRINTDRPQVAHVFTNKRPGTYITGESVDVVVEWSTPVKVDTTGGLPSLSIQNSSRVATFDASRSSQTQSVFLFMVRSDDTELEDFSYDAHAAVELNGGRISRLAARATIDADLRLIPIDLEDVSLLRTRMAGLSSKFQLVQDVRVVLRGLYHPRAQDLRARVFHGYRQSILFDACCAVRDAFGVPDAPAVLTNRAQLAAEARNPTSGVGWDYSFRDFDGVNNLALNGGAAALQSSTSGTCEALNAIDGKIRGVAVSTQTVARTLPASTVNESSWWELRLVDASTIGTIRIWVAEPHPSVQATVLTFDPVVYREEGATKATATTAIRAPEQAMFPFWVLLFDGPAVMDVESFADAYNRSIFAYRVDSRHANRSVVSVAPPLGTKAQYVRLVAEMPRGVLSIAEVEVFAEQNYGLSQYSGGTPVRTAYHPGGKSWSPEEPFRYAFGGMPSEDMAINGSTQESSNATAGGISDWALHITNQAGETLSYFMDFQAQLHALPRHGTLYIALNETERDHVDVDGNGLMDSMEADTYLRRYSPNNYMDLPTLTRDRELKEFVLGYEQYGGLPVLRDPSERQLRLPSLVCDAECLAAIKLDPYFYVGLEGDQALKLLRVVGDRVVKYVPQAGFRGTDAFTFSVAVAGQESRVLGTIQVTVKDCEDKDCRMASFFLHRSTR
uniref:YHYH domain-containing protein n=1 Tax=Phytophthora ramorum TaxID=164328 RepID=H3HDU4_PHYRM